jgi:geranylgeranyl diphosphate synthase type II
MPYACACECIHTYSLIHDDLPAMDNDDLRRGRPTSHKVFGEAMAILAGDALLTFAFRLVTDQGRYSENVSPTQALSAATLLSEAAGFRGMIGGQVVDIASEGKEDGTLSDLRQLHRLKTGALIAASVSGGGLLAGAGSTQLEALTAYGQAVGLAFQVADDILDVVGQAAVMGKNVGGDALKHKLTYPGLLGLEGARAEAARLLEVSLVALEPLGEPARPLAAIAAYIVERTS